MMTLTHFKKFLLTALVCASLSVAIVACSDDKSDFDPFDHSHDVPVTDLEKHKFEHEFADQCVARETKGSVNPGLDKAKLGNDCLCIAKYMMKDLTASEAEKFLEEHENTQSLVIRFDAAAYHCLQQKTVKGPDFSRK